MAEHSMRESNPAADPAAGLLQALAAVLPAITAALADGSWVPCERSGADLDEILFFFDCTPLEGARLSGDIAAICGRAADLAAITLAAAERGHWAPDRMTATLLARTALLAELAPAARQDIPVAA